MYRFDYKRGVVWASGAEVMHLTNHVEVTAVGQVLSGTVGGSVMLLKFSARQ